MVFRAWIMKSKLMLPDLRKVFFRLSRSQHNATFEYQQSGNLFGIIRAS